MTDYQILTDPKNIRSLATLTAQLPAHEHQFESAPIDLMTFDGVERLDPATQRLVATFISPHLTPAQLPPFETVTVEIVHSDTADFSARAHASGIKVQGHAGGGESCKTSGFINVSDGRFVKLVVKASDKADVSGAVFTVNLVIASAV